MASVGQVQGMLLEESLLYLLRFCGYTPITGVGKDHTLKKGRAGLEVRGRGENHQIDAIADFRVPQPFSNPSRLLIEAKFKDRRIGINVVRNAVGVLKDVSEYWATGRPPQKCPRYHYQYAILASSGFSKQAEQYAAAQDVYLIPFAKGGFFTPVLDAIAALQPNGENTERTRRMELPMSLSTLRRMVRDVLNERNVEWRRRDERIPTQMNMVIRAVREIEFSILAVTLNRLPLVLVPSPGVSLADLRDTVYVRIYWNDEGWYLEEANARQRKLFSFDLPEALFKQYAEQNRLSPERAVQLKGEALAQLDALIVQDGRTRLIQFRLDQDWIRRVLQRLRSGA